MELKLNMLNGSRLFKLYQKLYQSSNMKNINMLSKGKLHDILNSKNRQCKNAIKVYFGQKYFFISDNKNGNSMKLK